MTVNVLALGKSVHGAATHSPVAEKSITEQSGLCSAEAGMPADVGVISASGFPV